MCIDVPDDFHCYSIEYAESDYVIIEATDVIIDATDVIIEAVNVIIYQM